MSGYNNVAASMYGMYPNMYYNQVALNDLSGMDLSYPTGMTMDPLLGMNSSIFGTSPMMMGGMMGGMMPNPIAFGSNGFQNYFQNLNQYQDFMIDYQVNQQQKMRDADLRLQSPLEGIQKRATQLHEKILSNEQEQIKIAYQNFKESVKSYYGDNATAEEISNRASTMYKQLTGKSVAEDIRENGRDSFTQGVIQTLSFGLADKKTAEENIAELTGQEIGRSEKMKKVAGNAAGGGLLGGLGALALGAIWKAKGPIAKTLCKIPVLAAIGGVVAGAIAFAKN